MQHARYGERATLEESCCRYGQYLRYARKLFLSLQPRSASLQPSFAAELPPEYECAGNTVRGHRLRKRG